MLAQHFKSVLKQVVECLEPLVRRRIRLVRVLDDELDLAMQALTRLSHAPLSRASLSIHEWWLACPLQHVCPWTPQHHRLLPVALRAW